MTTQRTVTFSTDTRRWWNPDEAIWATSPYAWPLVDVRDMLVVHTALLRELRLAPAAVARVTDGDRRSAAVVDHHLGFVCDLLHHHHEGEDELLWPKLRHRAPAAAIELLDAVEAQHAAIADALSAVSAARATWLQAPDVGARDGLAENLQVLHAVLVEHLDLEERAILPLAAALLTQKEWDSVGEAAAAVMPKPALALAFGMFAYEADPEVLKMMLHSAPTLPRLLLPTIAPRLYARRAAQVHGTRHP